jgi:hypothetical protein
MTNRIHAWAAPLVLGVITLGCLRPSKPTAYSTEDVFGVAKPTYALGRQLHGSVVRLNPMAQMITVALNGAPGHAAAPVGHGASAGHGVAEEITLPVEAQGVAALRTLRPGARVALTCRAVDAPSLEARATERAWPVAGPVAVASPVTVVAKTAGEPAPGPPPTTPVQVAVASPVTVSAPDPHASAAAAASPGATHEPPTHEATVAAEPGPAAAPPVFEMSGGTTAGLRGLSAACPSVIRVDKQ